MGIEEFFEEAFGDIVVPGNIRRAALDICVTFDIQGVCDPLYICNVIAVESGLGDGSNKFTYGKIKNTRKIAERLRGSYGCNIKTKNDEAEVMHLLERENDL